eukprot:CAMPEP_0204166236 /NCGR_PEP_ID=MMETSP0361-20130328/38820_1 /ASSEMBLY_ACC=CAM_ASM_000343 /TAXON_ID=268821 /ORGANISM="Scrippsiella Hangoei, Strain SHTV-5" /LENGTH=275 /DNA_ID=CAMNT_0051123361 /DNA_START=83 /DNA_END=910 /DNA_ORIENTATION=-
MTFRVSTKHAWHIVASTSWGTDSFRSRFDHVANAVGSASKEALDVAWRTVPDEERLQELKSVIRDGASTLGEKSGTAFHLAQQSLPDEGQRQGMKSAIRSAAVTVGVGAQHHAAGTAAAAHRAFRSCGRAGAECWHSLRVSDAVAQAAAGVQQIFVSRARVARHAVGWAGRMLEGERKEKLGPMAVVRCLAAFAVGAGAIFAAIPAALSLAGFAAVGVASASWAAVWQAYIGNVAAGSLFAWLQSVAMGGLGAGGSMAVGTAGGATGFGICASLN